MVTMVKYLQKTLDLPGHQQLSLTTSIIPKGKLLTMNLPKKLDTVMRDPLSNCMLLLEENPASLLVEDTMSSIISSQLLSSKIWTRDGMNLVTKKPNLEMISLSNLPTYLVEGISMMSNHLLEAESRSRLSLMTELEVDTTDIKNKTMAINSNKINTNPLKTKEVTATNINSLKTTNYSAKEFNQEAIVDLTLDSLQSSYTHLLVARAAFNSFEESLRWLIRLDLFNNELV